MEKEKGYRNSKNTSEKESNNEESSSDREEDGDEEEEDHYTFLGNCPPTPPLSQH